MTYILGLNIGHNATAALLKDGKIIACTSEERYTRTKNYTGIPYNSIQYVLDFAKITMQDIEYLVAVDYVILREETFAKRFQEAYTKKSFKNKLFSYAGYRYPELFKQYYASTRKFGIDKTYDLQTRLADIFSLPKDKVLIIDHHMAHALSTCFNLPRDKETLIFTLDGEGMGICATVNIWNGKELEVVAKTDKYASIGYLYSIITTYLGMKPLEHEFKVMGLAPYAKEASIDNVYNLFWNLIWVKEDLTFGSKFNMAFADNFLEWKCKFIRFDVLAGAVQRLTEKLVQEWISKAIMKYNIHDVAVSGGVFMNVKANQKIAEMPVVDSLFVMPSCGDESNAIGCCFYGYQNYCHVNGTEAFDAKPIKDLYLGKEYSNTFIKGMIEDNHLDEKYEITYVKNMNKEIAKLLSKGEIVARLSGRSEWGARALGNRSILSSASDPDIVRVLNETIKDRDFWMPFTPSILDTYEKKYIINPKKIDSPYMVITFDSTARAKKDIPSAMHPYDKTIRPQIVTKEFNQDYYELLTEYEKLTGIGGILNTSFNLHGEPNVLSPADAIHTFEHSDLKYLALGNYLLRKVK